jgi:Pyridoxal-dependent decarboxylase conserved domain
MDADEFRKRGKELIDYAADYMENIRDRRPLSNVHPGYLSGLIPSEAPVQPDSWEDVFNDIERVIMPGVRI